MYAKYNPEKLVDVPTLVAKYGEGKLLSMVQKKYKEQETAAVLEPSLRQVQQLPAEEEDRFKDDAPYPDSPPPARPEATASKTGPRRQLPRWAAEAPRPSARSWSARRRCCRRRWTARWRCSRTA